MSMYFTLTTEKGTTVQVDPNLVESFVLELNGQKYEVTIKPVQ